DQTLDFGNTRVGRGVAYVQNARDLQPVDVQKAWANIQGRYFLVESVRYTTLKPLLDKLQASASPTKKTEMAKLTFPSRSKLVAQAFKAKSKSAQRASIQLGRLNPETGLVLDYQTLS